MLEDGLSLLVAEHFRRKRNILQRRYIPVLAFILTTTFSEQVLMFTTDFSSDRKFIGCVEAIMKSFHPLRNRTPQLAVGGKGDRRWTLTALQCQR
jgi:hypothetical protein